MALNFEALERRSLTRIENQFDFRTYESPKDFIAGIKVYRTIRTQNLPNDGKKLEITPESKAFYDKIKKERIVSYIQNEEIIRTIDKNKGLEKKLLKITEEGVGD